MARILLAETDQRIRRFFVGILSDCGHAVEACGDAIEATTSLSTQPIDVVVTDLVLEHSPDTRLAFDCAALGIPTFTLSGSEFRPDLTLSERPRALLEKPFRFRDLQTVLEAVAQQPASASAAIRAA